MFFLVFIVRLKFQKRSELKFVSRTIPQSGGFHTRDLFFLAVLRRCRQYSKTPGRTEIMTIAIMTNVKLLFTEGMLPKK
jgi:hypothetical protein